MVKSILIPIKQESFRLHTLLEKYTEPFSTLSWVFGNEDKLKLIQNAWNYLLQNQPHNSDWDSCPDYVIQDIWEGFRWSKQISDEIFRKSAHEIISRMKEKTLKDTSAVTNSQSTGNKYFITVFNPSPHNRTDVTQTSFAIEPDDKNKPLILRDSMGELIPAKFVEHKPTEKDRELFRAFVEKKKPLPKNMVDVVFLARGVPAMGYETYMIEPEELDVMEEPIEETFVNGTDDFLENNLIKVLVEKNGSLTVIDKETNTTYKNLNIFEDTGNKGCNYEYIPIEGDTAYTTKEIECASRLMEACPAYSEIEIKFPWKLPSSLTENYKGRSEERTDFNITVYVRIYPGNNKRIDIKTEFSNTTKWHQLRVIFPTEYKVEKEFVKSPYSIMEKPVDTPCKTCPQHFFMGLFDPNQKSGLAILNKGLSEHETFRDSNKNITIALTLFRGQDQKEIDQNPDSNKKIVVEYAIMPMKQNWLESKIPKIAEDYITPLRTEIHYDIFELDGNKLKKNLPPVYSFIEIIKGALELNAIKKSKNENHVILKFFNLKSDTEDIELKIGASVTSAEFIGLNEESLTEQMKSEYGGIEILKYKEDSTPWLKKMNTIPSILKFQLKANKIGTISLNIERNS